MLVAVRLVASAPLASCAATPAQRLPLELLPLELLQTPRLPAIHITAVYQSTPASAATWPLPHHGRQLPRAEQHVLGLDDLAAGVRREELQLAGHHWSSLSQSASP